MELYCWVEEKTTKEKSLRVDICRVVYSVESWYCFIFNILEDFFRLSGFGGVLV